MTDWNELKGYGPNRQITIFGLKWYFWAVGLLLIFGVVLFGLNWLGTGAQVISPENVRQQFQAAYDDMNALDATARNVCQAIKDEQAAPAGSTERTQRTSQRIAYQQNYERIRAHYNAYVSDPFRARLVRPSDLPTQAPELSEMLRRIQCSVSLP